MTTYTIQSSGRYYYGLESQSQDVGTISGFISGFDYITRGVLGYGYYVESLTSKIQITLYVSGRRWDSKIKPSNAFPYISTGVGIYDMRPTGGASLQIYPAHAPNAVQPSVVGSRTIRSTVIKSDNQSPAPETMRGQIYPIHKPKYTKNDHIKYGYPSDSTNLATSALLIFTRALVAEPASYAIAAKDAALRTIRRLQIEPSTFSIASFDAYIVTYNLIGSTLDQTTVGQDAILLREIVLNGESLVQSIDQTNANFDESTFFRDWARQTYGWDADFNVEWWAE